MYIIWIKGDYMNKHVRNSFFKQVNIKIFISKICLLLLFLLLVSLGTNMMDSKLGYNIISVFIIVGSVIFVFNTMSKEMRLYNQIKEEYKKSS